MSASIAQPLPECPGCDLPVARATAVVTGGVCSLCLPHFPAAQARAEAHAAAQAVERQRRRDLAVLERQSRAMRRRQGSRA